MLMVVPDEGKEYWLAVALGQRAAEDIDVELYSNNYTPVDGSTAANFTPATFTGSGVKTVAVGDWAPAAVVANVAETVGTPAPAWTCSGGGGELIYGWYMVTSDDDTTLAAQKFDVPRNMTTGATEELDPFKFKLKTFA